MIRSVSQSVKTCSNIAVVYIYAHKIASNACAKMVPAMDNWSIRLRPYKSAAIPHGAAVKKLMILSKAAIQLRSRDNSSCPQKNAVQSLLYPAPLASKIKSTRQFNLCSVEIKLIVRRYFSRFDLLEKPASYGNSSVFEALPKFI